MKMCAAFFLLTRSACGPSAFSFWVGLRSVAHGPLIDLSRYLQHFAKVQTQVCCYLRYMAEKRPGGTRFPIGIAIFPGTLRESPVPTLLLFAILGKMRLPKLLLFTRFRESRPPTLLLFAILRETRDFRLVLFTRSRASPRENSIGICDTLRSAN